MNLNSFSINKLLLILLSTGFISTSYSYYIKIHNESKYEKEALKVEVFPVGAKNFTIDPVDNYSVHASFYWTGDGSYNITGENKGTDALCIKRIEATVKASPNIKTTKNFERYKHWKVGKLKGKVLSHPAKCGNITLTIYDDKHDGGITFNKKRAKN